MKLAHAIYAGLLAAAIVLGWFGMKAKADSPAETLKLLRSGGYTIYFRHAATERNPNETGAPANEDCAHQRNLSAGGREQARRIGAAVRALKIPVSRVLAGPLCRTMETAHLTSVDRNPSRMFAGADWASRIIRGCAAWLHKSHLPVRTTQLSGTVINSRPLPSRTPNSPKARRRSSKLTAKVVSRSWRG